MKILIIINTYILKKGGKYFTNSPNGEFINQLKKAGNSISYCAFTDKRKGTLNTFDLEANGVKCYPLKYYKNKLVAYFAAYLSLIPIISKHDFVYFYYPSSFKHGTLLCKLFGKNYGVYVRGMQGVDSQLSHWIYKNASAILTVSDFFTLSINRVVGRKVAHTIRPMIPFTEKDVALNRIYMEKSKYSILYLGRLGNDKGIKELLLAVKQLKPNFNFELNLVGDGGFMPEAKRMINELEIEDVTHLKGAALAPSTIRDYYSNADIYILPTYHEGFPRTLYEAMIFGTPIITTFVGGIPTLMKDGFNCIEIKPKSVNSIVDALEFALENYLKMAEYAKNGTRTVSKIIDPSRMTHGQHLSFLIQSTY